MIRRAFRAAALLCLAARSVPAQEPVPLEDLVVTASRAPVDTATLPVAITVLQGAELRARGVRFLADALGLVPSLAVLPTGSWGGVTSAFLRGGESDYVRVLQDGIPVNASGGYVDFGTFTLADVDRIEVVRGPASLVHGSDAMTGVVQVFSRQPRAPTAVGGGVAFGSRETRGADAWIRGGGDSWRAVADGSWGSTDGTYDFNSDFDRLEVGGRASWDAGARTSVRGGARYIDHTSEFPTDFAGVPVDSNQANTGRSLLLDLGLTHWFGQFEAGASVGWRNAESGFRNASDSPGDTLGFGYAAERESEAERLVADLRLGRTFDAGRLALVGGMALEREHEAQSGSSTSNFGGGSFTEDDVPFDESRRTLGWYGEGSWAPTARSFVQAGVRFDDSNAFGSFTTWRAGAGYHVTPSTRLTASAGRAYKAPSLAESFADSPFERGNPDLVPERSTSWEVGARQALAQEVVVLGARWFDQRFRDMVQYFAPDTDGPTYFNLAEATARGLELEATAHPGRAVRITASYTRLWTDVVDGGPEDGGGAFVPGSQLLRRPAHQGSLDVAVVPVAQLTVGATVRYLGERDDLDFNTFPSERVTLEALTITDLTASWRFEVAGGLLATARLENLFDTDHEAVVGYPTRGRALVLGLRVGE